MNVFKLHYSLTLSVLLLSLASAATLCAQNLKVQFGFEDSGTTTTDSVASVSLKLMNASRVATDLHGPAGSGVAANGRALNLSSGTMSGSGPLAYTTNNSNVSFGSVTNFTIALWIKPTANIAAGLPRFLILGADGTTNGNVANSLEFLNNNGSKLRVDINTLQVGSPTFTELTNQWMFMAVTWDGQAQRFYTGTETNALSLVGSLTNAASPVNIGSTFNLLIGNYLGYDRCFAGYLDDVRFYTGAASSSFLESVRREAIVLNAPANLVLTTCGAGSLSWSAVPAATGYMVKRSTTTGAETAYALTSGLSFVDTNVTVGSTYYYQVVATNGASASPASTEISGTIQGASNFTIVNQPLSQMVEVGTSPSFSVAATGAGLTYQWQYSTNQGSTWLDIPTATASTYTTPAVTLADNGKQFRAQVISACGSLPSSAATLNVVARLASSQTLQMQFGFEDSGTTTADGVNAVSLNIVDFAGAPADYHGQDRSGVYDHGRALDFSSATNAMHAPLAYTTNNSTLNFGTITNFTVSMWIKPTLPFGTGYLPRFFILAQDGITFTGTTNSLSLMHFERNLQTTINSNAFQSTAVGELTNQWTFLTATWDGQSVQFYAGSETGAVSLVSSVAAPAGAVNIGSTFNLLVGNIGIQDNPTNTQARPFVGLMDDVRFYLGTASSGFADQVRQSALLMSAPTDVSLTTCSQAALSWPAVRLATGYIIKRSTASGAEVNYATTSTPGYVDSNVTVGVTYYYTVVATNSSLLSPASSEVSGQIQSGTLFAFASQPANQVVCPGDTATFAVAVSGGSGLGYQWQSSTNAGVTWADIAGANSATYTTPAVADTDSGTRFRVLVSSTCGTVPSAVATLWVTSTPATIVMAPFDQTVAAGWPAIFAVKATGTNLIYQWRKNTINLVDGPGVSGATTAVLTLTNLTAADSGAQYDCVIGPPCVAMTAGPANLTVNADAAQNLAMRFDFEDAGSGTTTADSVHAVTLTTVDATGIPTGNGTPSDFHGPVGSGVAGTGRALDFTTGTNGVGGPLAFTAADSTINFGVLGSFTITLWAKPGAPMPVNGFPRFFTMGPYGTTDGGVANTMEFVWNGGRPALYVNTNAFNGPTFTLATNQWRFLAATWDGQTTRLYAGAENSATTLLAAGPSNYGPVNIGTSFNLLVGNRADQLRSYAGFMDDVRFYLGAAPLESIEGIRQTLAPLVAPVASFSAVPVSGVRPLLVTFTNLTTGSFTNVIWNFGDATATVSGSNSLTHVYTTQGSFQATLTATGPGGSSTATNVITVAVPVPPQVTKITAGTGSVTIQGVNGPVSTTQTYYYQLLSSTNLTLPRASWTVIATNAFRPDGSFSNNIPVNPGEPMRFFLQQMP